MDHQTLAKQIVSFLTPFLPYLLKAGEKVAEEIGKKFSEAAWEKAQALWGKLRGKKEVVQVAQTAVALPENKGMQAALREEIANALQSDPALAEEIAQLMGKTRPAGTNVTASGNRSVAIGGDVTGGIIITGDRSQPAPPKPRGVVLQPVESSMIHAVGYDPERQLLEVAFNSGRVYCYEGVPPDVYEDLMAAESKGRFMRAAVIDMYPYHRGPC